jgi:hypothetical protein
MVQDPINVVLGSISDLNTVILPINEVYLWFVLAVEIMAIKLRETKKIRGIEIKLKSTTGNLNICQLADV